MGKALAGRFWQMENALRVRLLHGPYLDVVLSSSLFLFLPMAFYMFSRATFTIGFTIICRFNTKI